MFSRYSVGVVPHVDVSDVFVGRKVISTSYSSAILKHSLCYGFIFSLRFFLELYLLMFHFILLFCCILLFYSISPKPFCIYFRLSFYGGVCFIGGSSF